MNKKQIIGIVVAALAFVFVATTGILMKNWNSDKLSQYESLFSDYSNTVVEPLDDYIGIVTVEGTIMDSDTSSLFSTGTGYNHQQTIDLIDTYMNSSNNKGILLYVNTPGGSVYTTDELYLKLMEYKEETGRPIWAYFGDQACSGGYYASMAADKIYANRNCWTGSIGVIISLPNYEGLYDKLGIKTNYITSGENKTIGAGDLPLTDDQRAILQSLVDESYEQFVGIVSTGRNMSVDVIKPLADGRIYSANQAKENGLIDEVSGYEDMKEAMKEALDCDTIYQPENSFESTLFSTLFGVFKQSKTKSEAEIMLDYMQNDGSGVPMYYAKPGQ